MRRHYTACAQGIEYNGLHAMMAALVTNEIGGGQVHHLPDGWRLALPVGTPGYADAQLDDTSSRRRADLPHRPPTHLSLEARAFNETQAGTLGFGFWNDPFPSFGGAAGSGRFWPASPQALWFFGRWPPSDLPFAAGAQGTGWCAACIRAPSLPGLPVAVLGALAAAAMAVPPLRSTVIRTFWARTSGWQHDLKPGFDQWRRYEIDWQERLIEFSVDGTKVLRVPVAMAGPLGLVIWIDNQWATFTAAHGLHFGATPLRDNAWLEIRDIRCNGLTVEVPARAD